MPAPTLSTPAARIEVRDLATNAWYEWAEIGETDGPSYNRTEAARVAYVAGAIRDLGFLTAVDLRPTAASFASITVTACDGSSIVLDWEPCAEGFEYEGSGDDACDLGAEEAQREAEPEPETDGKVIDVTPTWTTMIGLLACLIERGGESRRLAIAELTRLAQFADAKNAEGTPHRIALLEVARVALSTPMRETVTDAMDISDEVADELLAEANRLLAD